jgi:Mn2+/Fe2+ NRAMP family transporter
MHWRRLASFLLGAWLMAMVFMVVAVSASIRPVDSLLLNAAPRALEIAQSIGDDSGRMLLRYQLAEQARMDLKRFEWVEVGIGVTLVTVLFLGTNATKLASALGAAMVLLTVFLQIFIGPEIAYLGRQLDFVNPLKVPDEHGRLLALQGTYLALTGVKLLLGTALAWYLMSFRVRVPRAHRAGGG